MRVISKKSLYDFWQKYPNIKQQIEAWASEVKLAEWANPNELKLQFRNASIISKKRVVFNIKGNKYILIVDIEYKLKIIFIVWIGSHNEYDKINVNKVRYVKAN